MSTKLTTIESFFSKVASATLVKILQEFRNNFLKETLRKAVSAAFHHISIKGFELKIVF